MNSKQLNSEQLEALLPKCTYLQWKESVAASMDVASPAFRWFFEASFTWIVAVEMRSLIDLSHAELVDAMFVRWYRMGMSGATAHYLLTLTFPLVRGDMSSNEHVELAILQRCQQRSLRIHPLSFWIMLSVCNARSAEWQTDDTPDRFFERTGIVEDVVANFDKVVRDGVPLDQLMFLDRTQRSALDEDLSVLLLGHK